MASMDSSSISSSQEGSAFPWILEHVLAYPGTYEIPLRTMYTLNSAPRAQPLPQATTIPNTPALSDGSSADSSPLSPAFPPEHQQSFATQAATEHFKSCLMRQVSQLPSQPFSLPPSFVTSFVRRCFTEELCLVDFTQALTAMDYLKDLETRRKRELRAALRRLGVDPKTFGTEGDDISKKYPGVATWIFGMQEKERKVEALYTQVYIGLRRWVSTLKSSETVHLKAQAYPLLLQTLINEMRLEPFNKANSIAMLNTLYPPATNSSPTPQLTSTILDSQRGGFFRYIQGVEKNGKGILSNLEQQGKRPNDENGWAVVRETVDKYLRTANGILEECSQITGVDSFDPESDECRHGGRRADSGISFVSADRPSTTNSNYSDKERASNKHFHNKPLPPEPMPKQAPALTPCPRKGGSTLERIAREIKKIRSRSDVQEISRKEEKDRNKGLKKMKSFGDLGKSKHTRTGSGGDQIYDAEEMNRKRMIWEAQREKMEVQG